MRSDKVHRALAGGMNRFEICRVAAKGVRATHRTGSRFEDSINDVLQYMSTHDLRKEMEMGTDPKPADRMEPAA